MKIQKLKIYSANLKAMSKFYKAVLGLKLIKEEDQLVQIQIGESILEIESNADATPYHFAINIPANMEFEALSWLNARVEVLKDGEHEIQNFDFWNAKAMYFYDADKNIVELIARKNLDNASTQSFNSDSFLEISEIGMPISEIAPQFNFLIDLAGLEIFSGSVEQFCAVGDEHGLFICIDKNKRDWFPLNDKAYSSDFELSFSNQKNDYRVTFQNGALKTL